MVDRAAAEVPLLDVFGPWGPCPAIAVAGFSLSIDARLPLFLSWAGSAAPLSEPGRPGMMRHAANVLSPLVARRTRR